MRSPITTVFLVLLSRLLSFGQDLHFSQFYLHPITLNPATTGVFEGDLRFSGLYRSQWASVPVSYQSFAAAADWKAVRRNTNLLSVGFAMQHDRAGDAGLTWTQAGVTAAVTQALGENQAIGVGFGFGHGGGAGRARPAARPASGQSSRPRDGEPMAGGRRGAS